MNVLALSERTNKKERKEGEHQIGSVKGKRKEMRISPAREREREIRPSRKPNEENAIDFIIIM